MLSIDFSMNLISLLLIIGVALLIGYSFRSRQIRKRQSKIAYLRREIVNIHAYILELQKENIGLELQMRSQQAAEEAPVLPLKVAGKDYGEEAPRVAKAGR